MPRWVYTTPRRILKGRVVPGHRSPGRWVVVRRLRLVALRRPRRLIVVGGRTVAATVQTWALVMRGRLQLERARRGGRRRPALDVPPTTERGTGFPKGGNGWPGSYAGDNATPGSRKGGDGG